MSQMDQEQSGEVPQMCPLELEWVLPCLGTLHIKTVEKVRDSFQEGINWLASTAAVCATILNVCVRNRVGEFGRSHYIPSSSLFFFKSAQFLPAMIGSSHNFVFTISNLNITAYRCFSKSLKMMEVFLFYVTCHSTLSSDRSCQRYTEPPFSFYLPPPLPLWYLSSLRRYTRTSRPPVGIQ